MIVLAADGGPVIVDIPGGWATVLVALISFVLGPYILQARANHRLKKIDEKTDRAVDQLENNHRDEEGNPINLREEADERHAENGRKLDKIIATQADHGKRLERLEGSDKKQDDRLGRIEQTWPRSRFMPPARHREPDPEQNGES